MATALAFCGHVVMHNRLLFVDNRPGYFLSHRLGLARAARRAGFEVHVAALTQGDEEPIRAEGFPYHSLTDRRRSDDPLRELPILWRLSSLYRSLEPQVLHHITLRAILYGGLANRFAGVPCVVQGVTGLGYLYSSDDIRARGLRWLTERGLGAALSQERQRVTFQNKDDLELFVRKGLVDRGSTVLIPGSGVDPDTFHPRPGSEESMLVVCPTRMLWTKGVEDFVVAARILTDEPGGPRFALVGDTDPDNPAAISREQLQAWDEEGAVEWWGYRDDMPEVLARSTVVCYPSRYREGVPKVLLETAASGRPAVTTDMPGCRDAVRDEATGFVVPAGRPDELAQALRTLLRNPDLRRSMGGKAREYALRTFTIDRVVDRTLALYEELGNWAAPVGRYE